MTVSFAIVAYNEEATLPRLLNDLKNQDYPHEKIEVLLIDSMSTDGTKAIMEEFKSSGNDFNCVKLLDNPDKTLPFGCNVMLDNYTGDTVVRIDAHASIPSDFISKNVAVIESGEYVCGGRRPNIIDDDTAWKNTLLIAEQSMFGSSIASYRSGSKRQYVSSLFHGMYRREVYDKVGKYNTLLARTEDNDMSYRINSAGFKMCFEPDIVSFQHTRSSFSKMLRQKFLNGYWIGKTMGVNPKCFSLFHFVPFAFVLGIIFTTVSALLGFPLLSAVMWSAYGLLIAVMSVFEIFTHRFSFTNLLLPFLFFSLHLSYGIGTLKGIIEMPFWVRKIKR